MAQQPGWPAGGGAEPGPYQPPYQSAPYQPPGPYQQPTSYEQPTSYLPGPYPAQGGYAPGGYAPGGPPAPVRKRHTGLKITLAVLVVLLVACGIGGFLVVRPVLAEYPATLSAPDTLAGMRKLTDPQFQQLSNELTSELKTTVHGTSAIGAFYAPNGDKPHSVMVAGATTLILNPGTQLKAAFTGLASSDLKVANVAAADAGDMGGQARCGSASADEVAMGVCAWADHGSVGMVVAYNRSAADTAQLMRTIRPLVLHRG